MSGDGGTTVAIAARRPAAYAAGPGERGGRPDVAHGAVEGAMGGLDERRAGIYEDSGPRGFASTARRYSSGLRGPRR